MSFVSFAFLFLFLIVYGLRILFLHFRKPNFYSFTLIAASLLFYAWHVPLYTLILLGSTAVDYIAGRQIHLRPGRKWGRKVFLIISLTTNLGVLAFFKYVNFALENVRVMVDAIGGSNEWIPVLSLVLPMGISFYTFQSMSYTIDIYRGKQQPVDRFWKLLLFVSLFPQLMAGPIVRAREFLPQLPKHRSVNLRVSLEGVYHIIQGYFLKVVIGDSFGVLVDSYWNSGYYPEANATVSVLMVLYFSMQIFCDFAGYSCIALGLGYLLGFRLPINFNSPYIADSFSSFWRRWHISLSRWLRDYLYFSLGGNRVARWRVYFNLMVVMLLGGLWHGAGFTFIIWGGIHGAALCIERLLGWNNPSKPRMIGPRLVWYAVVQLVVLAAWVFFRSDSIHHAWAFLAGIARGNFESLPSLTLWAAVPLALPVIAIHLRTFLVERGMFRPASPIEKALYAAAMLYGIVTLYARNRAFIYFQF